MKPDEKQAALAAIPGLTFADVVEFFGERASDRDKQIAGMVEQHDETCEVDYPIVSEGNDNGAYVMCWTWVSFFGTDLDKRTPEEREEDER